MPQPEERPSIGTIDWKTGAIAGPQVQQSAKTLGQLRGLFHDDDAFAALDPDKVIYRVQWLGSVDANSGGLLWGNTTIEPGRVGDEYFMTHGHFHANPSRCEYYSTIDGDGLLVLMGRDGNAWTENMSAGSIHYIQGNLAHRVVNVGSTPLRFVACWPSDAGHDYQSIAEHGFSVRVLAQEHGPQVVPSART